MKCPKCGHDDDLPFCLKCKGCVVVNYVVSGNYLVVTYRRPVKCPTS
jgi:hypothetical protein